MEAIWSTEKPVDFYLTAAFRQQLPVIRPGFRQFPLKIRGK
jgi:hypothetical protein